jgi:Fur family ferric uptake transcriptional regulator
MKDNILPRVKTLLKENNFRATDQRVELISILMVNHKPITLKEIVQKMGSKSAHEVTLYRMLASFKDAGLVRQIDFGVNVPYFELSDKDHDHHHIVCTSCKKVSDFIGCGVESVAKKALSQSKEFSNITHHSFELFGICKKCIK